MGIKMKLTDVEQSVYEGVVHDRKIFVELPNGEEMALFDPELLVDPSAIGEEVNIEIGTLTTDDDIERIPPTDPRIILPDEQPIHWNHHVFVGEILSISSANEQEYSIELDVGVGTIEVRARKEQFDHLSEGEHLRVDAIRSDIASFGS